MSLVIIQGGQTGVDRGAHRGAVAAGLPISGYMPKDARDERGLIPADVAKFLMRCTIDGFPARTRANLAMSHMLLLVVQDMNDPRATPGSRLTYDEARAMGIPMRVIDPTWDREIVYQWAYHLERARRHAGHTTTRLMVAGPRETRWANAESGTATFVQALAHRSPN